MTGSRFVQFHALTSYPAALLNRDDSGLAKRLPFGGAVRTRVSSQCLKRHWRTVDDPWSLKAIDAAHAVRSREVPELRIKPALDAAGEGSEEVRAAIVEAVAVGLYGKKAKEIKNRQALLVGDPEIRYLTDKARTVAAEASDAKDAKKTIEAWFKTEKGNLLSSMMTHLTLPAGLEGALFGRMMTSDPEANTDAAIHVAHAFTVHAEESESDYFTVVDDLTREAGETGSAGLFDTELNTGLYYAYVVVDVPGLIRNVGDDPALAGVVVEHLVHLLATVSPGAKRGSTAPYAYADFVLVETGDRQPRTLANAFRTPVDPDAACAVEALSRYLSNLDRCYGGAETRRHLSIAGAALPGSEAPVSLDDLGAFARAAVAGA